MTISSSDVATGIAALTITGVTIKDLHTLPEQVNARETPILFPSPDGFISGGTAEPDTGSVTFGTPSTRYWIVDRQYNYIYLHANVGSERGLYVHIPAMSAKADAIVTAIVALDLTEKDVMQVQTGDFGVLTDPSGQSFYGFKVTVTMRERINA